MLPSHGLMVTANGSYYKVHTEDSLRYLCRSCRRRNLAPKSILLCSWVNFVRGKHGSRGRLLDDYYSKHRQIQFVDTHLRGNQIELRQNA